MKIMSGTMRIHQRQDYEEHEDIVITYFISRLYVIYGLMMY